MGMGGGTNATFKDDSGRLKHSLRRSISAEPLAFLEVSLGSEGAYEDMPEQGMGRAEFATPPSPSPFGKSLFTSTFESYTGDLTNQSQSHRRRSIRASSAVAATKVTTPSSVSRVRLVQKGIVEASSPSEVDRSLVQGRSGKKTKKRAKQKSSAKPQEPVVHPQPSGQIKRVKSKSKKGNPSEGAIEGHFDYDQDTDNGSVTITPRPTVVAKEALYDDPKNYFEEPVCNQLDNPKNPLSFQCKWCPVIYRGHKTSLGNLKCHWDGFTQAGKNDKGCVNRHKAKLAGIKLPLQLPKRGPQQPVLPIQYNSTSGVLHRCQLGLSSAPFGSEDDPLETLWASPCSADCNSPQEEELVSQDKRYTFLHIIWKEILVMLTFKWSFFYMLAQTTDSGLNNNTMASMMYELLHDTPDGHAQSTMWDPTCMHIRCFCHKLALIVNVGLAALSLKTLPPGKMKQSVLGRLTEEAEPVESTSALPDIKILSSEVHKSDSTDTTVDSASDYGNADDEISDCGRDSESEEADTPTSSIPTQHQKSVRLQELCTKLDGVIKGITRSAAQRNNFEQTAQDMNVKVAPLIAGYGIRWNIKFKSHQKAIDARAVIDRILLNAQEESDPGVFGDVCFSPREWKEIDNLNRELEVFVKLTSYMEGNQSTGAHVIPKYLELKESLAIKLQNCWEEDSLYPMHHAMSKRVEKYLNEAMQCHTLVLATILHPCFRMYIFELAFGSHSSEAVKALQLLQREFIHTKQSLKRKQPIIQASDDTNSINNEQPLSPQPQSLMGRLASHMKSNVTTQDNEITDYLNANLSFEEGAMNNKATPLQWWKVHTYVIRNFISQQYTFSDIIPAPSWSRQINQSLYPTLAVMARAYLGSVGSLCVVEGLFSAAADVCSSNRGRLLPSTMSHCVSSLMCLREEVPLTGSFAEAGRVVNTLRPPQS
ncbi:hypothetical protein H4Q26_014914 [Puccinia striiformis f. sp. tritici PST-130]|nr:hypothetical protein H4Q26_014914 [Puccinia striiformis f. sp. tritici PST-130]